MIYKRRLPVFRRDCTSRCESERGTEREEKKAYFRLPKYMTEKFLIMQQMKWLYAVAGSGVVLSIINYFREEKRCVENSWTTNFTPSVKWDSNWDKREFTKPPKTTFSGDGNKENVDPQEKEKSLPTATRNLIFIRHGQYNLKGAKDIDRCLTPLGRSQAEATGIRLKQLNFNYSRMVQSTLTRAKETASIIHKHLSNLTIESCDMLCEGSPIPPEPPIGHWKPEASQFYEDGARIEAAFRKYFHRADLSQKNDSYEIFVCHANVIRYFICRALQFPPEAWLRFTLRNCSLTWIAIRPSGRVVVYAIGDSGHLPPEKLSTS